mgnify:CR=1 FL=1
MIVLQGEQIPPWVQDLLTSEWAYLVLLALCVLEGLMVLRFMPSEVVVPGALFFIGTSLADVILIIIVAVIGTTTGQMLLFVLVRRGGRQYVVQRRWFPVSEERLERFDRWFDSWGPIVVPLSNTMLFVRGLFTFPAALSDMRWRTFLALSALGSTVFQTILAGIYLYAGRTVV